MRFSEEIFSLSVHAYFWAIEFDPLKLFGSILISRICTKTTTKALSTLHSFQSRTQTLLLQPLCSIELIGSAIFKILSNLLSLSLACIHIHTISYYDILVKLSHYHKMLSFIYLFIHKSSSQICFDIRSIIHSYDLPSHFRSQNIRITWNFSFDLW